MKKFILFIALCATAVAWGEERKLLTMEDAILNSALTPKNYDIRFSKDNSAIYEHANGNNIEQYDIRTGKLLSSKPILIGMPNPFRNKANVWNNNIVWYDGEGNKHNVTDFTDKNIAVDNFSTDVNNSAVVKFLKCTVRNVWNITRNLFRSKFSIS